MKLKELRQNKGMSLSEVSNQINISKSALSRYERYQRFPDPIILKKIQELYQLNDEHISMIFLDYFHNKEA